jgi:hypothetical protein
MQNKPSPGGMLFGLETVDSAVYVAFKDPVLVTFPITQTKYLTKQLERRN